MNVLVDTEILIWVQTGTNEAIASSDARNYLLDDQCIKWISGVSLLEIAIKLKIGKLKEFKITLPEYIHQAQEDGFRVIPINQQHIVAYDQIPFFEDHRDPRSDASV